MVKNEYTKVRRLIETHHNLADVGLAIVKFSCNHFQEGRGELKIRESRYTEDCCTTNN